MTDEYIRKQDVVDYCKALMNAELVQNTDDWGYGKERYNQTQVILVFIENRPPADVAPVEILKAKIYKLKCQQDSKNQDYYTGYMSALSTVEGILAEMDGEE